jgi:hypothetical protein
VAPTGALFLAPTHQVATVAAREIVVDGTLLASFGVDAARVEAPYVVRSGCASVDGESGDGGADDEDAGADPIDAGVTDAAEGGA